MSIQAVAWVLSQNGEDLPSTARLVMIALANHADHTSGHCWPSVKTIASEAGCSERTASRYLYALSRNGFIDVRRTQRKSGQFRSNDYWILFERTGAPWQYFNRDPNEEPEDEPPENEPAANLADGQDGSEAPPHQLPTVAAGPSDTVGSRQESLLEPSDSEPSGVAQPPTAPIAPPGRFDPEKRLDEQAMLQAAEEARKPKAVFVIKLTPAWQAWIEHKRAELRASNDPRALLQADPIPTTCHNGKQGWWLPTLFPPRTDPP